MSRSFICCTVHCRGTRPELSTPVDGPTMATWALTACPGLHFVGDLYLGFNFKRQVATASVSWSWSIPVSVFVWTHFSDSSLVTARATMANGASTVRPLYGVCFWTAGVVPMIWAARCSSADLHKNHVPLFYQLCWLKQDPCHLPFPFSDSRHVPANSLVLYCKTIPYSENTHTGMQWTF